VNECENVAGALSYRRYEDALLAPPPSPPKWKFALDSRFEGAVYYVQRAPNKFHRWMQAKFLGIYWREL